MNTGIGPTVAVHDDDDEEENYSEDEFESYDEEEDGSESSSILQDGCSGSTVDTLAQGSSQAAA